VAIPDCLDLWWPSDQAALIQLARGDLFGKFYVEAAALLARCALRSETPLDSVLLDDAIRLNRAMFALPYQWTDEVLELSYPVGEAYRSILAGRKPDLSQRPETVRVERSNIVWVKWDDWYEDLLRRVYLRKNYLYPIHLAEPSKPFEGAKPELAASSGGRTELTRTCTS
jgi:hypothetical protein